MLRHVSLTKLVIVPAGRFARSLFQMIKVSQARLRAKQGATPASDVDSSLQFNLGLGEQAPTPSLEYTNDFAHLVHPHPGVYELGGVANDITHGLLSTEGDWPEWIQTSVRTWEISSTAADGCIDLW